MVFFLFRRTFLRFTRLTTLVVLCLTILSFSSSLFVKADEDSQPCTVTNETTKKYYDLGPLTKTEGDDWTITGYGWKFYINICQNVLYKYENSEEQIGVYGISTNEKDYNDNFVKGSLGTTSKEPFFREDNLIMEFTDGMTCKSTNYKRSSVISFICDQTVEGQGKPTFVSSYEDCGFFFEWRTPVACPTEKKGASNEGWGVFFTIFIIALIVYFVGGIVYNRMVHNASGVHQIPNWEFWSNTWDFLKDMILIIFAQCPVFKPRRPGGRNYRNLPRDEEHILIEEEFEEH
ncbi:mannose-6-phosphate receptor binding domain-containing protein [Glomus cerebriforme]|uniref:Autophagy-related protein 27 n=1 Tax=Glomus cerebriforme TaxID=658196 RepID=A0A397SQY6_9GLOM|nr:mannose-6-phosphate receptor binding domain-containing protein [Glomus cerebriforme]